MSGYDTDFCGWANEQAALPRAGRLNAISSRFSLRPMLSTSNPWTMGQILDEDFYPE